MTVFRYFIKSALRQKWVIIGYSLIFFTLSIINGSGSGNEKTGFMQTSLNIGLVDNSGSELSRGLIDYLDKHNKVVEMEDDLNYINEEIFLHEIDAAIIIPENFQTKVEKKEKSLGIIGDDRRLEPLQIENEINKYLAFANATYREGKFNLQEVELALDKEVEVTFLNAGNHYSRDGVNLWSRYYFNFASYVIIAIYIAVLGLIMADFNTKNIRDRTQVSSKKLFRFNAELYLGQVLVGLLITSAFVLGSIVISGKNIAEVDLFKYVLNLYVFSFSILCFTFLVNNITSSRFLINGISVVASLGTSFISGVFLQQQFLGEKVLALARFFPTYYYVKINDMNTNSFSQISYDLFMQVLFGLVFLALGIYFSKARQKT